MPDFGRVGLALALQFGVLRVTLHGSRVAVAVLGTQWLSAGPERRWPLRHLGCLAWPSPGWPCSVFSARSVASPGRVVGLAGRARRVKELPNRRPWRGVAMSPPPLNASLVAGCPWVGAY
jgi:hypothetical protein